MQFEKPRFDVEDGYDCTDRMPESLLNEGMPDDREIIKIKGSDKSWQYIIDDDMFTEYEAFVWPDGDVIWREVDDTSKPGPAVRNKWKLWNDHKASLYEKHYMVERYVDEIESLCSNIEMDAHEKARGEEYYAVMGLREALLVVAVRYMERKK